MKSRKSTEHSPAIYTQIKPRAMLQKKKSLKLFLKRTKSCLMQKSVPNTMKHDHYLNEAAFAHHKGAASKAEISAMYLAVETHKISSQIYLVVVDAEALAKVKICKQRQQLHFGNQYLEQHLICV